MNILCLTDAFWPDHAGGISKTVLFEVEGLLALGHNVTAVSRRLHSHDLKYENRGQYELYRYSAPSQKSLLGPTYPLATLLNLSSLVHELHKKYVFDVAYINNMFQAAAFLKAGFDIPIVYVFHASAHREVYIDLQYGRYGRFSWAAKLANVIVRKLEKRVLDGVKSIIVRSEFMHKEIIELYGDSNEHKIRCIPLGIDMDRFVFVGNSSNAREALEFSGHDPVLLTVRRLVARTGVDNLILSMKHVVKKFPTALLLVGGKGYLEDMLLSMVRSENLEKNIIMLGFIPENKLAKYYQAADLFILPTLMYEGFGLSTLEAFSCGTPVIATPVGANPEVLQPLNPAFILDGTDSEAIGYGIIKWLEQCAGDEWRKRCHDYCTENFMRNKVCGEIESVLFDASR